LTSVDPGAPGSVENPSKIARAVRGGQNRRKLVRLLQRLLARVANSRYDFLNQVGR
jgi:hypothetical protein